MSTAWTFEQARQCVLAEPHGFSAGIESVPILECSHRVLAEDVLSDRDHPATARSVRDGFAVHVEDVPGTLTVVGEVRAGEPWLGPALAHGQAIEIMTGAPMPAGANAVVMVEHVIRNDDGSSITTEKTLKPGEAFNPQGSESKAGATVIAKGRRLTFTDVALLATVGRTHVAVRQRPTVAILATGDEVVEIADTPQDFQVRNSNSYSLAVQVQRAGGLPTILPVARDVYAHTRTLVEQGLQYDLLLLSGGVSAGKYDIVEKVLSDLGATFYFDRVKVQPGQPLVFGRIESKLFFGLPGNPASTMVTFEVFARAVIERMTGIENPTLPLTWATLTRDFRHKPGLRRFLPAFVGEGGTVTPVGWSGSSDVPALARANAFLVADPEIPEYKEGSYIQVLLQQS